MYPKWSTMSESEEHQIKEYFDRHCPGCDVETGDIDPQVFYRIHDCPDHLTRFQRLLKAASRKRNKER